MGRKKKNNNQAFSMPVEEANVTPVEESMTESFPVFGDTAPIEEPEILPDPVIEPEPAIEEPAEEVVPIEVPVENFAEVAPEPVEEVKVEEPVVEEVKEEPVPEPEPEPTPAPAPAPKPEKKIKNGPIPKKGKWRLILAKNPSPLRIATIDKKIKNTGFAYNVIHRGNDCWYVSRIYNNKEEAIADRRILTKAGIATIIKGADIR